MGVRFPRTASLLDEQTLDRAHRMVEYFQAPLGAEHKHGPASKSAEPALERESANEQWMQMDFVPVKDTFDLEGLPPEGVFRWRCYYLLLGPCIWGYPVSPACECYRVGTLVRDSVNLQVAVKYW